MADNFVYRALSNIRHGVEEVIEGTGEIVNTVTEFPYGSIVKGLKAEDMKKLWEAGVLQEEAVVPEPEPKVTKTTTSTPAAQTDETPEGSASGDTSV
jgi:hypothetical protein